ncbi:carbohydrate kinase family protein [Thioalkalivibrio sp. HK1]|uniref:carbohydrate kinase family protein n=1 Tax=Thioalkalivibrio sp. HK1 TaxID=1469245 RepID=UPI000470E832|nr:carbohydrate kinase [Thioalkalivibrio sp. HK1]
MYLVCGEALFDCFVDQAPSSPEGVEIQAVAGGSPLNVARGIARMGGRAAFFGGLSTDDLGDRLHRLLESEGVETRFVRRVAASTPLSFVGTDRAGLPSYVFYNQGTAECAITLEDIPVLDEGIHGLHIGSYPLTVNPIADALFALVRDRKESFISLDPNVRPAIVPDMQRWRERVEAMVSHTNLVRTSIEDLEHLYPMQSVDEIARRWLASGPDLVIVTCGYDPVLAWGASGERIEYRPRSVDVVDTVGAGDTFQAALLTRIAELGPPKDIVRGIAEDALGEILAFAASAAVITCQRRGADLPSRADIEH